MVSLITGIYGYRYYDICTRLVNICRYKKYSYLLPTDIYLQYSFPIRYEFYLQIRI